ncbi:ABC transporter ATP-binding protein [Candidatus Parcubacteria bacterium]|jgi:hypothetical protein|nr:ABC transporter ATP-binding protein [Candidatus Parcubacteria bacterium]MBT7228510.1 ABC transporter ATP-binding protein [Candidatus Parcubacteria bacterium]
MDSFYKKIYKKSFLTVKNNYNLLFFGLFASILGFYEVRILLNLNSVGPDFLSSNIVNWVKIFAVFSISGISSFSVSGIITMLGMFIFSAIMIVLAISSQGALINASIEKANGKTSKFNKHLQIGLQKFWPLLGLNVVNALIGYFFIISVVDPLIGFIALSSTTWVMFLIMSLVVFFVLIPLVIILSFVTRYGAAYVILKDNKFKDAFYNGWNLFKINWLVTVENAIFLLFVTIFYFIILLALLVFIFTPFLILGLFLAFNMYIFWFIFTIGIFLGVIIFLVGTSKFGAYYNLIWANVFLELTAKGKTYSKVHRVAHKHMPKLTK